MFRRAHLDERAAQVSQQGVAHGLYAPTFDSLGDCLGLGGPGLSQAVEGLRGLQMAAIVLGDLLAPAAHGATLDFSLLAPATFGALPARFDARLATDLGNLFASFILASPVSQSRCTVVPWRGRLETGRHEGAEPVSTMAAPSLHPGS